MKRLDGGGNKRRLGKPGLGGAEGKLGKLKRKGKCSPVFLRGVIEDKRLGEGAERKEKKSVGEKK